MKKYTVRAVYMVEGRPSTELESIPVDGRKAIDYNNNLFYSIGVYKDKADGTLEFVLEFPCTIRDEKDIAFSLEQAQMVADKFNELEEFKAVAPNGIVQFSETLHDIAGRAEYQLEEGSARDAKELEAAQREGGSFAVKELVRNWATEFEKRNEGRDWDGEYVDEIDEFIGEKIFNMK